MKEIKMCIFIGNIVVDTVGLAIKMLSRKCEKLVFDQSSSPISLADVERLIQVKLVPVY